MAKKQTGKIMLAEHILEVRHKASGTFLDVRGYVADYIRNNGQFPHWNIDTNVVNFHDDLEGFSRDAAFVGYKSAGYVVNNADTRNYFIDRASSFWTTLLKNKHYQIPNITRFGCRTKAFIPSDAGFDEINKAFFEGLFTAEARKLVGGHETDVQIIINLTENPFDVQVRGGPVNKDEVGRYLNFESEHFKKCGLFLDIDFFKIKEVSHDQVRKLLKESIDLAWLKIERIASGLGI